MGAAYSVCFDYDIYISYHEKTYFVDKWVNNLQNN